MIAHDGQHQDLDPGKMLNDVLDQLQPVAIDVIAGHIEISNQQFRLMQLQLLDQLRRTQRLACQSEILITLDHLPKPQQYHRMIVGNHYL